MKYFISLFALLGGVLALSGTAFSASGGQEMDIPSMVTHPLAIASIVIFVIAYAFVLTEEYTFLRKSKPVLIGAGLIWLLIGIIAPSYYGDTEAARDAIHDSIMHGLEEYAALFLFLLSAMTYIATLINRNVFAVLRSKLVGAGLTYRQLFLITGVIAFFLSPVADNLTTALVLGAVALTVGAGNSKFIALACINIVNAANAGGAFSPFGDITTLMVWQADKAEFFEFFRLFLPSVACFTIPAVIMMMFVSNEKPKPITEKVELKRGARIVMALGFATIAMAVSGEQLLGLPPFMGMMFGLGILMTFIYFLKVAGSSKEKQIDALDFVRAAEWDTLLFFFGVIFAVGGLSFLGYLELASTAMYDNWGATNTNIALGAISAVVDNIPVMFAVLTMDPSMSHFQWLLITLTTGVGGSMLSIGSAAGVALMGTAHGHYTFVSHLKWSPVLALGYIAAIGVHFLVNGQM